MLERFRRKGNAHLPEKGEWERIGYLAVTVHHKDGKLHFSVKARGSFEQFEKEYEFTSCLNF